MRYLIFSIIFHVLTLNSYCQCETEIYEKLINDFVLKLQKPSIDYSCKTTITIKEKPNYKDSIGTKDYLEFLKKYKNLEKETFFNFVRKRHEKINTKSIDVPTVEVVMLMNDSIPDYQELSSKFPFWIHSIIEFSKVGFNLNKTQAMVYHSYYSGLAIAGGAYMIFEKKRNNWKLKRVIQAW